MIGAGGCWPNATLAAPHSLEPSGVAEDKGSHLRLTNVLQQVECRPEFAMSCRAIGPRNYNSASIPGPELDPLQCRTGFVSDDSLAKGVLITPGPAHLSGVGSWGEATRRVLHIHGRASLYYFI